MDTKRTEDLDQDLLQFEFIIRGITFNEPGTYSLRLSIQNLPYNDLRGVFASSNEQRKFIESHVVGTDAFEQSQPKDSVTPKVNQINFVLPKGFCKNDGDHEVLLQIDVFNERQHQKSADKSKLKVGESKFAIYPRENTPPVNVGAALGEDMYVVTDEMTLYRVHTGSSTATLVVNPGAMKYVASLRKVEHVPIELPEQNPVKDEEAPQPAEPSPPPPAEEPAADPVKEEQPKVEEKPASAQERVSVTPTSMPPTDGSRPIVKGDDCPLPLDDELSAVKNLSRHVSATNSEELHVIIHAATNLPRLQNNKIPMSFCSVKTKSEEEQDIQARVATDVSSQSTCSPSWERFGVVLIDHKRADDEMVLFKIIDLTTNTLLVCYRLLVMHLRYFHQYHLEMIMPTSGSPDGVRLTVSITRKTSFLPVDRKLANYFGLEVLLKGINETFEVPDGPVTAVLRIATGHYTYKRDDIVTNWSTVGIKPVPVLFPNPPVTAFTIRNQTLEGSPQVTMPGYPEEQPTWNQSFMFGTRRDIATLFTPQSGLVIEFYRSRAATSNVCWRLMNPVGNVILELNQKVYQQLMTATDKCLSVNELKLQNNQQLTTDEQGCSVALVLRLITSEKPDSLVNVDTTDVPTLVLEVQQPTDDEPVPTTLPPLQPEPERTNLSRRPGEWQKPADSVPDMSVDKDIEAYRALLARMDSQIRTLNDSVQQLQHENESLRRQQLASDNNPAYERRPRPTELENLAQKYADDYRKLMEQSAELKKYKKQVLDLHEQLMATNDIDTSSLMRSLDKRRELHEQTKAKGVQVARLETACKNQERNIERLEKLVNTNSKDPLSRRTNAALRAENRLLRIQLQNILDERRQEDSDGHHRQWIY